MHKITGPVNIYRGSSSHLPLLSTDLILNHFKNKFQLNQINLKSLINNLFNLITMIRYQIKYSL